MSRDIWQILFLYEEFQQTFDCMNQVQLVMFYNIKIIISRKKTHTVTTEISTFLYFYSCIGKSVRGNCPTFGRRKYRFKY